MKLEFINCPFCGSVEKKAVITYEENRIYQCKCQECNNTILHEDRSWDSAVEFFKGLILIR